MEGGDIQLVLFKKENKVLNKVNFSPLWCISRELVEELHPLMKEALERRPEVM